MGFFATGVDTETSQSIQAEMQRERQLSQLLKELQQQQGLISIKLGIALRGGLSKQLRKEIHDAADAYGLAFEKLMNSCPEEKKYLR